MVEQHHYGDKAIVDFYRDFARETGADSPLWQAVSNWVIETPNIVHRLDQLTGLKRQPNLFLASLRFLAAPLPEHFGGGDELSTQQRVDLKNWVLDHWDEIYEVITSHRTQTNEVGRAAVLAPVLASLPQPINLIEVGCSAGCLLFPDLYRYDYGHRQLAAGAGPIIPCHEQGNPPAITLPTITWRAGIDLDPLDPADPAVRNWLRALIWPGQPEREHRLLAALDAIKDQQMCSYRGDGLELLSQVLAEAPGPNRVVLSSVALPYFSKNQRVAFESMVRNCGSHWVNLDADPVLPSIRATLPAGATRQSGQMIVALDGQAIARAHHHGNYVQWF